MEKEEEEIQHLIVVAVSLDPVDTAPQSVDYIHEEHHPSKLVKAAVFD